MVRGCVWLPSSTLLPYSDPLSHLFNSGSLLLNSAFLLVYLFLRFSLSHSTPAPPPLPSPPSLPELPSPSLLHKPDMLNSSKTCNNGMLFTPWSFDPHSGPTPHDLPGDDEQGLGDLLSASGVPNLKSGQYPAFTNMFTPEQYLSTIDFSLTGDWLAVGQANYLDELNFPCGYDDFANMDPSNLARLDDCVTNVENNIDICQELLRLGTNLPMFDQSAPWDQPGAWQPTPVAPSCSPASTLDASVGFHTPSSSSAGDHEESSDHQQNQRKNVLNPPYPSCLVLLFLPIHMPPFSPFVFPHPIPPTFSITSFRLKHSKKTKETKKSRPNNVFFPIGTELLRE